MLLYAASLPEEKEYHSQPQGQQEQILYCTMHHDYHVLPMHAEEDLFS